MIISRCSGTPRMARSEVTGSRLSVGSTNPFDEDGPVPPVRTRRKKKRAPLPPHAPPGLDVSVTSENSELHISETDDSKLSQPDVELESEDTNLDVELKIVEDEDIKQSDVIIASPNDDTKDSESVTDHTQETPKAETDEIVHRVEENPELKAETIMKGSDSEDDILSKASFPKIDIVKYRRNSSVNDDDIRLRRGNLEDYHALTNKRSKSLTNALDSSYASYDINLNEDNTPKDANGNEEPQKVVCKFYEEPRRQSVDTVSSTEKEFMEIDRATRELEREISKLNSALNEDEDVTQTGARLSVSDIKRRFDNKDASSPNPIPKPRRSHYGDSISPVNGNI
ncbi:unnamed protein product [Diatraea saccharalis]|uniref:Uncharacterized protein n=1 Tax=Diatraea saccharalis TaxID=40085 RepID=A0A9P0CD82_9NEOP|nr:unnamed protein product [Diatraea saccharalis]